MYVLLLSCILLLSVLKLVFRSDTLRLGSLIVHQLEYWVCQGGVCSKDEVKKSIPPNLGIEVSAWFLALLCLLWRTWTMAVLSHKALTVFSRPFVASQHGFNYNWDELLYSIVNWGHGAVPLQLKPFSRTECSTSPIARCIWCNLYNTVPGMLIERDATCSHLWKQLKSSKWLVYNKQSQNKCNSVH